MHLFIQLPGSAEPQLLCVQGSDYPADVKKAIITEFKQLEGAEADQVVLKQKGKALESAETLTAAGIQANATLVVELTAAAQVAGTGVC